MKRIRLKYGQFEILNCVYCPFNQDNFCILLEKDIKSSVEGFSCPADCYLEDNDQNDNDQNEDKK